MSEIINVITAKPEWQTKINDETIVAKWKEELEAQGIPANVLDKAIELLKQPKEKPKEIYREGGNYPWHIEVGADPDIWTGCRDCECMICTDNESLPYQLELEADEEDDEDYREILKQLKRFAKIKCKCQNRWIDDNLNFLRENIYHKVNLVKADLKQRFLTHVKDFEARKTEKDYHPGSNDQMLDFIHPALYCYVKGVTPVVGEGEALVDKSSLFQWIPSDFSVIRDPTTKEPIRTEIRSYINNLDRADPRNGDLYEDISEIFTTMVPGFEKVLNKMKADNRINAIKTPFNKQPRHPQDIQLNDCQVIVKIASAEVNSDKPEFSEGSWHLEGVDSEKIIATGIYYYDMKGTDKSYLRFRTTLTGDIFRRSSSGDTYSRIDYPTNCAQYVRVHCGLKLENRNNMDIDTIVKLGRIPTKENLSLFFPNFLQHRVSSLHLKEGATEGHRSILVFFLINPFEKVISTSHIPTPQQETVSLGDAKLYRELLMFERKYEYTDQQSYHQRGVTLCEH